MTVSLIMLDLATIMKFLVSNEKHCIPDFSNIPCENDNDCCNGNCKHFETLEPVDICLP